MLALDRGTCGLAGLGKRIVDTGYGTGVAGNAHRADDMCGRLGAGIIGIGNTMTELGLADIGANNTVTLVGAWTIHAPIKTTDEQMKRK